MILSDGTIRKQMRMKRIVIEPEPHDWQLQPASVDLTLAGEFMNPFDDTSYTHQDYFNIAPGECVLGTTVQRIEVPTDMVARVEGKSTWGRRFITIHATAGFIDPGFRGQVTLELTNLSKMVQPLPVGSAIAQVSFMWVDQPVVRPYGTPALGSHYQDQEGVRPAWT